VSVWDSLKGHVDERRGEHRGGLGDVQASLIGRLKELAHLGACDKTVVGWFTSHRGELTLNKSAPLVGDFRAIPLRNLEHIDGGLLTIRATFDRSGLRTYSIQLRGTRRIASATPWYARVDLDDGPKGVGLCSHAELHTHVGTMPEQDDLPSNDPRGTGKRFSTRVPTPWLAPVDALNWLLASVDRRLEPAPHPRPEA
jgi:hypothetical protein